MAFSEVSYLELVFLIKELFFPMVFFKMAFIFNDLFTGVPRALQSGKQEVEKEHSFMTFGLILVIFQD